MLTGLLVPPHANHSQALVCSLVMHWCHGKLRNNLPSPEVLPRLSIEALLLLYVNSNGLIMCCRVSQFMFHDPFPYGVIIKPLCISFKILFFTSVPSISRSIVTWFAISTKMALFLPNSLLLFLSLLTYSQSHWMLLDSLCLCPSYKALLLSHLVLT